MPKRVRVKVGGSAFWSSDEWEPSSIPHAWQHGDDSSYDIWSQRKGIMGEIGGFVASFCCFGLKVGRKY